MDTYSAFGCPLEDTKLAETLKDKNVERVYVCGLAFDYCVGNTDLNAVEKGFETYL